MTITEFTLDHFNFFCPVSGIQLFGDGEQNRSPALLGVWNHEVIDEPEIYDSQLKTRWEDWLKQPADQDDEEDDLGPEIDDFLAGVQEDGWTAFRINTGGALMPETVTLVINMNYEADS